MATISLYLNKKYKNKAGEHQIQLRVSHMKQRKYYSTGYLVDESSFAKLMNVNSRLKGKDGVLKKKLIEIKDSAEVTLVNLSHFSYEAFEYHFKKSVGSMTTGFIHG